MNETAWSCNSTETCDKYGGSNGGYSTYFRRPTYQNGKQSNLYRGVPDLSSNAYPHSGFYACFTGQNASVAGYSCHRWGGKFIFKINFSISKRKSFFEVQQQ